jgi:hypothetical protein
MKKLIAMLVCLGLMSCGGNTEKPLKQTRDDKQFTMVVEIVQPQDINEKCNSLGSLGDVNGCAAFNLDTKVCTIYVMPQRFQQDEERLIIIGHETMHCRYGQWHD